MVRRQATQANQGKAMSITTEIHMRIYDDHNGSFLTVRPSPDFPEGNIMLCSEGKDNEEYFGPLRLDLSIEYIRSLGVAMVRLADEMKKSA
jgi:hypothetical protein